MIVGKNRGIVIRANSPAARVIHPRTPPSPIIRSIRACALDAIPEDGPISSSRRPPRDSHDADPPP